MWGTAASASKPDIIDLPDGRPLSDEAEEKAGPCLLHRPSSHENKTLNLVYEAFPSPLT